VYSNEEFGTDELVKQPLSVNASDTTKPLMEMIEYEADVKTLFFVLNKSDGKQLVLIRDI
jgi:hypothetical protein